MKRIISNLRSRFVNWILLFGTVSALFGFAFLIVALVLGWNWKGGREPAHYVELALYLCGPGIAIVAVALVIKRRPKAQSGSKASIF